MASDSVLTQADMITFYNTYIKPYLLGNNYPNFAPIETSSTASDDYAVGKLIVFGGRLCEVTTAISSGGTIEVGTNVKYTDVDEQFSDVNSALANVKYGEGIIGQNGTFSVQYDHAYTSDGVHTKPFVICILTSSAGNIVKFAYTSSTLSGFEGVAKFDSGSYVPATNTFQFIAIYGLGT